MRPHSITYGESLPAISSGTDLAFFVARSMQDTETQRRVLKLSVPLRLCGKFFLSTMYAEVAVPVYVRQTYTYRLPELFAHKAWPGCRLIVPFGRKLITGYIVAIHNKLDESLEAIDLKYAEELVDEEPILTDEILELTQWVADYYLAP